MSAGLYGAYGGRYVPETLIPALDELEPGWARPRRRPGFDAELDELLDDVRRAGRRRSRSPSASRPGKRLYLKREDLLHTGAHKLNNALGQARARAAARQAAHRRRDGRGPARRRDRDRLRALRPRLRRLHGQPRTCAASGRTSSACACSAPRCGPVEFGTRTLKEATSEAIRDWIANVETTLLPDRLLRRPAPVPGARRGAAGGDRHARRASRCSRPRAGCPRPSSPASAAARTRSGCSPASSTTTSARRRRGRRARRASVAGGPESCTAPARRCSPTRTGRCSTRTRSPPASTIRASARSTRFCATAGRAEYVAVDRRARRSTAFRRLARTEGIIPALEPVARARARGRASKPSSSSSASRAAATRISPRSWRAS